MLLTLGCLVFSEASKVTSVKVKRGVVRGRNHMCQANKQANKRRHVVAFTCQIDRRSNHSSPAIPSLTSPNYYYHSDMSAKAKEVLSPFGNALAGSGGAMLALTVVYPLDM